MVSRAINHFTVYSFFDYAPQAILNSAGAVEYEKMEGISRDLPQNREITKDILYDAYKLAEANELLLIHAHDNYWCLHQHN